MKTGLLLVLVAGALGTIGCGTPESDSAEKTAASAPVAAQPPAPDLPPAGEPLTDFSSCKVEASGIPATMKAGSDPSIAKVIVTNSSAVAWPAATAGTSLVGAVAIAYYVSESKDATADWLVTGNHVLLPRSLEPGGSATVDLRIAPPAKTGSFILFVSPVQETVAWFGRRDGCVYSTPIVVN